MQFWDQDHVLATQIAKDARDPQPTQRCCVRNDHLWDLAAVYRAGAKSRKQVALYRTEIRADNAVMLQIHIKEKI